jgi:hypothetical protein
MVIPGMSALFAFSRAAVCSEPEVKLSTSYKTRVKNQIR